MCLWRTVLGAGGRTPALLRHALSATSVDRLTLLCVVKGHFKIEFFLGSAEAGPVVAVSSPVLDGAVGSGGGEAWVRGASR
jgi:hypothetical protein